MSARILIVDDGPQICRVMRATLCAAGYVVTDARSGEEATERAQAQGQFQRQGQSQGS
jgi:CheY-like chemotaxis protein